MPSDRRIRVAIASEPGKAGVKTHVVDLLTHLDLTRFEVTYYYSRQRSDAAFPAEIARLGERGIECVELPMDDSLGVVRNLRLLWRLVGLLRRRPPDVLHLHSSKAGALGRLASRFVRPRPVVLYTPHAMACYRSRVYLWLEWLLGFLTDTLIAVSNSEKQDFIRWHIFHAKQAEVVPLGIPPMAVETEAKLPEPGRRWTIGACGRICYQKNARLFFQTALELLRQGHDYHFKWIGEFGSDAEAAEVRAMLDRAGNPPQIEITGWMPQPQGLLATLDVFCMFSRYESFGYVTAEAMLLGVPVVATPATGTIDLVRHEETGLLAPPNVEAVTAAIHRLEADPALRARLADNARRLITGHHTIPQMVAATERLYARPVST